MSSAAKDLEPLAALPGGRRQLHLTGFMGVGKSTVAQRLARRLVWSFLDLDAVIARRAEKSVRRVFAEDGEAAFRSMETECLRQVVLKPMTVVALGGGTLIAEANRELCAQAGELVWLRASLEEIMRRGGELGAERPLWGSRDELERLLEARRPGYETARVRVDAIGDPDTLADRVLAALGVPPPC